MNSAFAPQMSGTLTEAILTAHSVDRSPARSGRAMWLNVDWVLSSELSLAGMMKTFERLDHPPLRAPDRFYLAVDHTVDPVSIREDDATARLVRNSRQFASDHGVGAFYDANETIMHTQFFRRHCQPGSLVVGADSHTTSHGAMGSFAIGLGGADVAVAAITGRIWYIVPEQMQVRLRGHPAFGITGKDIVLAVLSILRCNATALDRVVEYHPQYPSALSLDARFTICNMTAELGGVAGLFPPLDHQVVVANDDEAMSASRYVQSVDIDLAALEPLIALPFSPDNVVPLSGHAGKALDGVFIGACTTTAEELVLGALVLQRMLRDGHRPVASGKRMVVPGSSEVHRILSEAGLIAVYRSAGFHVLLPGCHLCLGLGSEKAGRGETWMTTQNRNYRNRMGEGSLAILSSAPAAAASSLSMTIADPRPYLEQINPAQVCDVLKDRAAPLLPAVAKGTRQKIEPPDRVRHVVSGHAELRVTGRALVFGDDIDTDAIIPGAFCKLTDPEALGRKAFHHTRPEFPELVAQGLNIVVAGKGWGCGSSREHAAWALKGAGILLVIARSFGAIHRRNLINEGIAPLTLASDTFHGNLTEGDHIEVDLHNLVVHHTIRSTSHEAEPFNPIELDLLTQGGLIPLVLAGRV